MTKIEMIEKMKTNKEAFQFWPTELKEFAISKWVNMRVLCETGEWIDKENMLFGPSSIYRLSDDFKLPEPEIGGWKEFEVVRDGGGILRIKDAPMPLTKIGQMPTVSEAWLYAIDRGMCPQFSCAECPDWAHAPVFIVNVCPAMPVKMRVWEEGK